MYILDTVFRDLKTIMNSIVIKYDKTAKNYETIETTRASDRYMSAVMQEDSFNTYQSFDVQAVTNAGVTNPILAERYAIDKHLIPIDKRQAIVQEQRKLLISQYVEQNNYYRMLQGLPDVEDMQFIFVEEAVCVELGLDHNLAIHQYSREDILKLEKKGYLDKIKAIYTEKKYLNYLGNKAVDLARARNAKNFGILYINSDLSETFYEEFNNIYEQCREYFMSVIYIPDYGKRFDYYDNFIGMCIMIMTIQRIISNVFKYGIERDFYDLGSIEMMFRSYNVPFIEDLPLDYQRILVRNLNNLLHYKSTDKVLYDICQLLGFERIKIYKYFLVREHKMTDNEKPIFVYKEIENDDGSKSVVEDPESMYNLYFQTVELRERNMALALSNSINKLEYDQVVTEDPYWWDDDEELKKAIYETEYNYVESKYLNMNVMYKLTEMLFEVIYAFRMMMEKKDEIADITIELPKLFERRKIPLFNVVIFMCALIARKNNMAGNIIATPSKTLSVLGFNFKADFAAIRDEIRNSKYLDNKMLDYIMSLNISDPEDINELFQNVQALNNFIVEKLGETQDLKTYRAYKKLHKALMISEHTESLFTMSNGKVATTFLEYLDDQDLLLANFVRTSEDDRLSDHIEHVLYRINMLVTDLKYLYIINDSNNVLLNAAITMIRFFKSYTTDLASFNIMYLMNSRYYNMIKFMHDIKSFSKDFEMNDVALMRLYRSDMKLRTDIGEKMYLDLDRREIVQHDSKLTPKEGLKPKERIKLIRGV